MGKRPRFNPRRGALTQSSRPSTSQRTKSQATIDSQDTGITVPHIDSHVNEKLPSEHSRLFSPEAYGYESSTPIDELTQEVREHTYLVCPGNEGPCPDCGHRTFHYGDVVIAVDGFLPNNGKPGGNVFSSAGVYVGEDNSLNGGYTLVDRGATNQTAELKAAIKGLETAMKIVPEDVEGGTLSRIVIKADSKYVVEGITQHIYKWKANGWLNSAKKPVANQDLWERLDKLVDKIGCDGTDVNFWWVPRKFNVEADQLAEWGLSEVMKNSVEDLINVVYRGDLLMRHLAVQTAIKDRPELCYWLLAGQGQKFFCTDEARADWWSYVLAK